MPALPWFVWLAIAILIIALAFWIAGGHASGSMGIGGS